MRLLTLAWLCWCSFASAWASPTPIPAAPPPSARPAAETPSDTSPGRWALLIGVDHYSDETITSLRFPARDARRLAEVLITHGGYPPEQVLVMTPDQLDPAMLPTRANVLAQLKRLQSVRGGDTALLFFSGHGAASQREDDRTNYLFPMDARLSVPEETAISVEHVISATEGMRGFPRRVLLLDACRNALSNEQKAIAPPMVSAPYRAARGTQVVFSTAFGEYSFEHAELGMGAFSHFLTRALTGEADGATSHLPDGEVTVSELFDFLDAHMTSLDPPQRPMLAGEHRGDLVVAQVAPIFEPAAVSCPMNDDALRALADEALLAFETHGGAALLRAHAAAQEGLHCLNEPMSVRTALQLHHLEALRAAVLSDPQSAILTLAVAHQLAPGVSPFAGESAAGRQLAPLLPLAQALPAPTTETPLLPGGVTLWVDGGEDQPRPVDRPGAVQAVNWDGSTQWSVLLPPGEPLPGVTLPPFHRQIRAGTIALGVGAGLGLAATAGLAARSTSELRDANALVDAWNEGRLNTMPTAEVAEAEAELQKLRRATAATAASSALMGAGFISLQMRF